MANAEYLFVYGTLLKNVNNQMSDYLFSNSEKIGSGFFYGKLYKVSWYPGAILSDIESDKVYGSIFKLNNANIVLKYLDDYEDVSKQLYKRLLVNIFLKEDKELSCWAYIYNQSTEGCKQIMSGDFLKP